jgi:hypothetical protein
MPFVPRRFLVLVLLLYACQLACPKCAINEHERRNAPSSSLTPFGVSLGPVKRATITLSDDLEEAVERYVEAHDARPPLTAVVQAALRQYLTDRGYLRSSGPLRITPARKGSGRRDVSRGHDRYLAAK